MTRIVVGALVAAAVLLALVSCDGNVADVMAISSARASSTSPSSSSCAQWEISQLQLSGEHNGGRALPQVPAGWEPFAVVGPAGAVVASPGAVFLRRCAR